MTEEEFHRRIRAIGATRNLTGLAVAVHDYAADRALDLDSDRWFHAASVIKLALLLAVFRSIDDGLFRLDDPVHVRNRFRSVADGALFRLDAERDGDAECHRRRGRTMQIRELLRAMIVRSSNLATNLLLDLLGLDFVERTLAAAAVPGVRMRRGVEDHSAFESGINNEMTAAGARSLLRALIEERVLSRESREHVREVLLGQEFNSMIPAKLPEAAKVAHKTGEISTHSHDAGIIYPPEREPYVLAIFTESAASADQRAAAVAEISKLVYEELTA